MKALAIVPSFNIFKDGGASLGVRGKGLDNTFALEGAKEALHDSIIITIACLTHTDLAVCVGQAVLVGCAGILASLVRVMKNTRLGLALLQSHLQSTFYQGGFHVIRHSPPHHLAGKQIQDRG